MEVVQIETRLLGTRRDARQPNEAVVRGLIDSIAEIGLVNPLRVRARRHYVDGFEADGFEIIAGSHRFRACLKLGLAEVPCVVVDDGDLLAELAMIDENLCRAELSPADRASQTARRKAIYLKLHPETAQHVSGGLARHGVASENFSFAAETAKAVGRTERSVQMDAERGAKVCIEAIDLIRGTDLDKGTYLDKLKKLEPEEQVATVNRALSGLARAAEREKAEAAERRSQSRIEADVQDRAARELAEIFVEHLPADLLDAVKANLHAAGKVQKILAALNNLAGQSIIDRAA